MYFSRMFRKMAGKQYKNPASGGGFTTPPERRSRLPPSRGSTPPERRPLWSRLNLKTRRPQAPLAWPGGSKWSASLQSRSHDPGPADLPASPQSAWLSTCASSKGRNAPSWPSRSPPRCLWPRLPSDFAVPSSRRVRLREWDESAADSRPRQSEGLDSRQADHLEPCQAGGPGPRQSEGPHGRQRENSQRQSHTHHARVPASALGLPLTWVRMGWNQRALEVPVKWE